MKSKQSHSNKCSGVVDSNSLTLTFLHFCLPASGSESDASPEKRARVSEVPQCDDSSSSSFSATSSSSSSPRSGAKQRSRKRCHRCQTKLELVQQELGSCRCGRLTSTVSHPPPMDRRAQLESCCFFFFFCSNGFSVTVTVSLMVGKNKQVDCVISQKMNRIIRISRRS